MVEGLGAWDEGRFEKNGLIVKACCSTCNSCKDSSTSRPGDGAMMISNPKLSTTVLFCYKFYPDAEKTSWLIPSK